MPDKLEVLPGPGLVARFGEVAIWAGPQATPSLQAHLVSEAQQVAASSGPGDQLANSLIAVLQRGDPEPQAPFAVVGPGASGLTLFLHGPVQAWDSGRWLAPQPVPGWMVTSIGRPWPLIILPYGAPPPPQSQPGNPFDLQSGAVPGSGFILLRPPAGAGQGGSAPVAAANPTAFGVPGGPYPGGPYPGSPAQGSPYSTGTAPGSPYSTGTAPGSPYSTGTAPGSAPGGPFSGGSPSGGAFSGSASAAGSGAALAGALVPSAAPTAPEMGGGLLAGAATFGAPAVAVGGTPGPAAGAPRAEAFPGPAATTSSPPAPASPAAEEKAPVTALGGATATSGQTLAPGGAVDLRLVGNRVAAPLPVAYGTSTARRDRPEISGSVCARGHLNHPRAATCARCGNSFPIGNPQRTGPRPAVGILLADDGSIWSLDGGCLIGNDPSPAPDAQGNVTQTIAMRAGSNHTMAPVQAEIQVVEWDAYLVDRGADGGTCIQGVAVEGWSQLARNEQRELISGSHLSCGGRVLTYLSAWPSS